MTRDDLQELYSALAELPKPGAFINGEWVEESDVSKPLPSPIGPPKRPKRGKAWGKFEYGKRRRK